MAQLKDSGERRQFESGAVRDIQKGKGRCDLLPLDIVGRLLIDESDNIHKIFEALSAFIDDSDLNHIYSAIEYFCFYHHWSLYQCILEVSKQYEDGANKYGEHNWEKGIPIHCYLDSGIRHLLKFLAGYTDEPHDRAFIWNMLGLIWTYIHKPDLIDI